LSPRGFSENLLRRVATALVALPALLFSLFAGPVWLVIGIVMCAGLLALHELFRLLELRGLRPLESAGYALAVVLFYDVARPQPLHGLWLLGPVLLLGAGVFRRDPIPDALPSVAGTLLASAYTGGLAGSIAGLYLLPGPGSGGWRVTLLLATIMLADTAAYFVGSAIGKRRLAPAISPGKSVEGALAGIAGGVIGAAAVRAVGLPALPATHALALGAAVAAAGAVGDLAESLLKRWAGVKDSGALFPGHGGMLDRLDSLLFGAPVLYYYFLYTR
jgi:phosphatidate cytidylyltransferase